MHRDAMDVNRVRWDELAKLHPTTEFYDVEGFRAGRNTVDDISLEALGDVRGKTLLHLQCHFGMDTLSLARLGAVVTGVDFSSQAVEQARELADEAGLEARFIQANIYDLPDMLDEQFDIVFTSHGVLTWLPDIAGWGQVVGTFVKLGGRFFILEGHPIAWIFDQANQHEFGFEYGYFGQEQTHTFTEQGTYADMDAILENVTTHEWHHRFDQILNALIDGGLRIQRVGEYPFVAWQMLPFMEEDEHGWWRIPPSMTQVPLMFSIAATK